MSDLKARRELERRCEHCGAIGWALSTCSACGEFIGVTLSLDITVDDSERWHRSQAEWHEKRWNASAMCDNYSHEVYKFHEAQMLWHGRRLRKRAEKKG